MLIRLDTPRGEEWIDPLIVRNVVSEAACAAYAERRDAAHGGAEPNNPYRNVPAGGCLVITAVGAAVQCKQPADSIGALVNAATSPIAMGKSMARAVKDLFQPPGEEWKGGADN